ncbi:TPA: prolipoprotein diacylglyceryl transferase [Candidatus Falkowbacteria bacterium]|nr:prolipoprotein diacylglyceryl transferase [Candidatus Falkowbacteria bacterium]
MNFLHKYIPEPIIFSLGPIEIHWYGLLMVLGGLAGLFFVRKLFQLYRLKEKDLTDLVLVWVLFALIGARIYYVIYAWDYYRENLIDIIKVWEGGLAVHGVMLGVFGATYWFCRWRKINFWLMADIAAVGLAGAQIIGRWGNYFNQEIFGKPTDLSWGIPIEMKFRPSQFREQNYFHPTVLYESLLSAVNFIILWAAHQWRVKRNKYLPEGVIFAVYIFIYSVIRFGLEYYRVDYSPMVFGLRWAQLLSIWLAMAAIIFVMYLYKKKK